MELGEEIKVVDGCGGSGKDGIWTWRKREGVADGCGSRGGVFGRWSWRKMGGW